VPEPLLRGVVTFPSVFRGDDGSTRLHRGWRSFAGPGTMSPCDMKFNGCPVVRMNNPSKRKDSSSRVPSPRPEDRTPCGSYLAKNCVALPPGLRSKPSNKVPDPPIRPASECWTDFPFGSCDSGCGVRLPGERPPDTPPKERAGKTPPRTPCAPFHEGFPLALGPADP
jgi:hypothetical protein